MLVISEVRYSYVIYLNLISIENACVVALAYCIENELKSDIKSLNKKTVLWQNIVLFLYSDKLVQQSTLQPCLHYLSISDFMSE